MKKKLVVKETNERIIPASGLAVVGAMLGKSDFVKKCNRMSISKKRSQPQIKNGDILLTQIGLLCQGKPAYDNVNEFHDDPDFYKYALGITREIPSSATLRQRLDDIGSSMRNTILGANIDLFQSHGISPSSMENGYVPVDMDVTPMDNSKSHKEGVSRTYKGCDGFAPMMAYIGTEGYLANAELRVGSQHCQKGTPDFLRETLSYCHQLTSAPLLVRLDSGNDAAENIGILLEDGDFFIIKRNLRREGKEEWLSFVKEVCQNVSTPREGKTVYKGSTFKDISYKDASGTEKTVCLKVIYEVIERSIDKKGQYLFPYDIEVNTWWMNLPFSDDEVIDLYHAHGECEQYHSEIKTDMDLERLPSGKFETNELIMELAIIAYNILRIIGNQSLRKMDSPLKRPVKRRRARTIITNLILMCSHVTNHARQVIMGLGRSNAWRHNFIRIAGELI
ncbi:MAG: IS1380 family transposase [Clostridiales bacterium]|nr:IS1380 family transposase [Clostridiales bacterium]